MKTQMTHQREEFMEEFITMIDKFILSIKSIQEQNIQLSPSFYQRQQLLKQIKADIKSGKIKYNFA
jgi:hypothetical protein